MKDTKALQVSTFRDCACCCRYSLDFFDLEASLSPSLPNGSTTQTTILQNGIEAFVLPA
jgi:hypothetical protein